LTTIDVSNNTELIYLDVWKNQLTSLDVTHNLALEYLDCDENQLSALEVSNNYQLHTLWCGYNQLTYLDISSNAALKVLGAYNNSLSNLDISNNTNLERLVISDMKSLNEVCIWAAFSIDSIEVDTAGSPNVCFQTDCNGDCTITGIVESGNSMISIYPNPANDLLTIETYMPSLYSIEISSMNGHLLFTGKMEGTTHQINLSSFQGGIYFITIKSKDFVTTRKIIKL
jgi:hypothetical protein